jgi:peptidoglycan/xylan/chitin deacetylase (PgdA/CDA1 family)
VEAMFMLKKKHRLALTVTAFVLTGFIAGEPQNAHSPQSDSSHDDNYPGHLQEMIQKAAEALEQAPDMRSWQQGGYAPKDVFHYAKETADRADDQKEIWKDLCTQLHKTEVEKLSLFRDEIIEHANNLLCHQKLLRKIERYWAVKEKEFNDYAAKDFKQKYGDLRNLNLHRNSLKTDKNHEITVNPSKGPVYPQDDPLKEKEIVLTFDDGPHPIHSAKILKTLKSYQVRANYFQVGEEAKKYKKISQRIADAGNIVGSHSFSHPNFQQMDICHAEKEIIDGRDAVVDALNTNGRPLNQMRVPFFRFPFGESNDQLVMFVKDWAGFNSRFDNSACRGHSIDHRNPDRAVKDGLASFNWDIDSKDWKHRDPITLYSHLVQDLGEKRRGIILLHDTHEQTAIILPHLLNYLIAEDYSTYVYVPVSHE